MKLRAACMCALGKLKWHLKSADLQKGEVVEYKYFVSVLKYIFLVSVLYSTTYFSDDFLLWLLTFWTPIPELSTSYMLNPNTCTFYFSHFPNRLVPLVWMCVWWRDHYYLESLRAYWFEHDPCIHHFLVFSKEEGPMKTLSCCRCSAWKHSLANNDIIVLLI